MGFDTYGGSILRTEGGVEIKVHDDLRRCVVYFGNTPEVVVKPDGASVMEQEIPHVAFVGYSLKIDLPQSEIVLLPVLSRRLRIPYGFQGESRVRYLNLQCSSNADQFPARIRHDKDSAAFLSAVRGERSYKYIVVDKSVSRSEMLHIKTGNPGSQILIVKGSLPAHADRKPSASKSSAVHKRAVDLAASGQGSANPVFLARIYLRKLELDRVGRLLGHREMTAEEAGFIRAFIEIMLRNQGGKEELSRAREALSDLRELYLFGELVLSNQRDEFYKKMESLESAPSEKACSGVLLLIERRQSQASEKLQEIYYWEWSYRWRSLCSKVGAGSA